MAKKFKDKKKDDKTWLEKVKDGDPFYISASQGDTFVNLCKRKWWLRSVRKLRVQSGVSQVFGSVLHEVGE